MSTLNKNSSPGVFDKNTSMGQFAAIDKNTPMGKFASNIAVPGVDNVEDLGKPAASSQAEKQEEDQ